MERVWFVTVATVHQHLKLKIRGVAMLATD
jgi:hypothetical protein